MDREGEANKLYSENAKASVLCMLCDGIGAGHARTHAAPICRLRAPGLSRQAGGLMAVLPVATAFNLIYSTSRVSGAHCDRGSTIILGPTQLF